MHGYEMEPRLLIGTLLLASLPYDCFSFELYFIIIIAAAEHDIEQASVIKVAFHDTDTDILARILADTSDTRDFLKLFRWQAERHADIAATMSASASWNAGLIEEP